MKERLRASSPGVVLSFQARAAAHLASAESMTMTIFAAAKDRDHVMGLSLDGE